MKKNIISKQKKKKIEEFKKELNREGTYKRARQIKKQKQKKNKKTEQIPLNIGKTEKRKKRKKIYYDFPSLSFFIY